MRFYTSRKQFFKGALYCLFLLASFQPLQAKALQAVVTHNTFYAPGENNILKPYLEAYWQIDPSTVIFQKTNELWQGQIKIDIVISNETGTVNEDHYILATKPATQRTEMLSQTIIDLRRIQIPPGKTFLQIKFTDEFKKTNEYTYNDSFLVAPAENKPMLSDIQLVDTSIASDAENTFQRNGYLQIPLCTSFIDDRRKTLGYYSEVYHTDISTEQSSAPFVCKAFISKKEFESPINMLVKTDTVATALVQAIRGKFVIATLPSGNYYLNIVVENSNHEKVAGKTLFFQLLNTKPDQFVSPQDTQTKEAIPNFLDLNKTFLKKYTPAQIRAILKMLLPVAEPGEKAAINNFIKTPDDTYARYFIYNFWLARNKSNPEQGWKAYAEKIKEVNKLFGSSMMTGYENDRGYIYLKYGAPTERIVVENEMGALPYEIWQYNSLPKSPNAVLLFYRPGFINNDYKLLHTTVNGEVRNKSWRTSLYSGGTSVDAENSRAEQYIGNR